MKAVITGDIVQSTRLSVENRSKLIKAIQYALKVWQVDFKFKSEFFRGDSFQCLLNNPHDALRVALLIKTFIRSLNPSESADKKNRPSVFVQRSFIDARIAIGIGTADVNKSLATSGGMAFALSGHLLDEMKEKKQSFDIATDDQFDDELKTESILLDALINKTSAFQCEVINLKLLYYSEIEIGQQLNINQSAVNQRSRSGNWNAIVTMVNRFEDIYPA